MKRAIQTGSIININHKEVEKEVGPFEQRAQVHGGE